MALKALIKKEDFEALSDVLKEQYAQVGDTDEYALDVEEAGYKEKLGEFRGNNIKMRKQIEDLQKVADAYKDVDPKKYKEMQKQIQALEDKKLIDEGEIDKLVEQRTERMRSDFEGKRKADEKARKEAEEKAGKLESQLSTVLIDKEVQSAVSSVGAVKKGAMQDVLSRARTVWKLQDGQPVPMEGDTVRYGKDGKSPMTMGEWAESLLEDAPYLFEGNKGGGAKGGGEGPTHDGKIIARSDKDGFSRNLDKIAKGEVRVDPTR